MDEIDLADLDFDFESYFERHDRGELDDGELQEFDARVIGLFCRRLLTTTTATGDWTERESFAAYYLAKKLRQVIGGVPWTKSFSIPFSWGEFEHDFTKTGKRAADIFCAIHNALRANPALAVTELIHQQADEHCVSFETARADYYRAKRSIEEGGGFRPFLNFD